MSKMDITIPYYEDNSRISNSAIGWFLNNGPAYLRKKLDGIEQEDPSTAMKRGTAIHMALLQPEEFNKNYVIWDSPRPKSQQQEEFCAELANTLELEPNKAILSAYRKAYRTNDQADEKVLSKGLEMAKELHDYITHLKEPNRTILSVHEYRNICSIKQNVHEHKLAKELLNPANGELKHEFHINWEAQGVKLKSLLDSIHFNNATKTCTITDVKTTSKLWKFEESVVTYDYVRQLCFYNNAAKWYIQNILDDDITTWTFKFYIIAVATSQGHEVRVFELDEKTINVKQEVIIKALNDIAWHFRTNLWEHSRAYYESAGQEKLNL